MVLVLPSSPGPASATPRLLTARNELRPAFGGGALRLNRKGSRYAFDFVMPPMTYTDALAWTDLLTEDQLVAMAVPQPGLTIAAEGSPRVNGAGQAGTSLNVDGATSTYPLPKGRFLSIITSGERHLYQTASAVTFSSGAATLSLRTMLRRVPGDNDVVELQAPMIEGYPTLSDDAFAVGADKLVSLKFSIEERR